MPVSQRVLTPGKRDASQHVDMKLLVTVRVLSLVHKPTDNCTLSRVHASGIAISQLLPRWSESQSHIPKPNLCVCQGSFRFHINVTVVSSKSGDDNHPLSNIADTTSIRQVKSIKIKI